MGSSILISIIQRFNIPVDAVTFFILVLNFTVIGTISVFSNGIPIIVKQSNMVVLGIIVAAWFTALPEWTTWVVLVALALYDLAAVLAPGGPLKLLVELASTRDEELPALVYESRPNVVRNSGARGSREHLVIDVRGNERENGGEIEEVSEGVGETLPLVENVENRSDARVLLRNDIEEMESEEMTERGIKLGMGDFIFYSVLVGRAAMYDLMTVYACYLAIISGLGCTLILLAVCRHALPALPISIALGVMFYFLTRLLMEPFVVGASTNLMMF
ncbi:hypothetical protein RD792_012717 [Penstemon davidsonii]|uniref:Presenilin n=1 Tax=Penstemon davidsonii TaxID=160366 RepID=A0ABR0CZ64_9LAMI|nr:hypothetical protein RD792_012717 [Penstemon davidsonii]